MCNNNNSVNDKLFTRKIYYLKHLFASRLALMLTLNVFEE